SRRRLGEAHSRASTRRTRGASVATRSKRSIARPASSTDRSMLRTLCAAGVVALVCGCAATIDSPRVDRETQRASPRSGIDLQYVDRAVRPQDDLYRALNGKWLDTFVIPADKGRYGSFDRLRDDTELQLKAIVEEVAAAPAVPGSEAQKIRDLYRSFMD